MTWHGTPLVFRKNELIVIAPRCKSSIMEALNFECLFSFEGPFNGIRTKSNSVYTFDKLFSDDRIARLIRIDMDIDSKLRKYMEKRKQDKRERANALKRIRRIEKKASNKT